jgi:hypothetical protein
MPSQPQLGWIWPKDPRPGNPQSWPRRWRFFDILANKGPDIYVGEINQPKGKNKEPSRKAKSRPTREEWSRWSINPQDPNAAYSPFPWVRRGAGERYDFRTRKYHVPDHGTWSAVEYCNGRRATKGDWIGKEAVHFIPRRYRDRNGVEYPAEFWHDSIYGRHAD